MKSFISNYLTMIMYTICGILLILSSYSIIININHASYLNKKVVVSDRDIGYKVYKENIIKIENFLNQNKNSYNSFLSVLTLMKQDGIYTLMPGDCLGYNELYNLNNYFIDTLINNGWISNLKQNNKLNNTINNEYMNILINNSNYINKEILNNSNYHYDVKNNEIRDTIEEEYQFILNNYRDFSNLILNIIVE